MSNINRDLFNGSLGSNYCFLGKAVYTPSKPDDALHYMDNPAEAGDYDWYPTRYIGTSSNGGVHSKTLALPILVRNALNP